MPIYSKDFYLDAVYCNDWQVVTVERNEEIVASLPFYLKKKGPFEYIAQHFFTQTMGPYIRPDFRNQKQEIKLFKELIEALPEFDGFDQCFHYSVSNWMPFYWEGFKQTTKYTYVIDDITDLDAVWQGFSSSYRNKVKKAEQIVELVDNISLEEFYAVAKMTFERQGEKMIYDFDFLQQFDSRLYMECRSKILAAKDKESRIHSVLYLTLGDETAHLHLAGENPDLRNSGAGIFLIWEAIKFAKEEGLTKFDFQGSMIPGVERVRRDCGAIQKPYFQIWKHPSFLFRMFKKIRP